MYPHPFINNYVYLFASPPYLNGGYICMKLSKTLGNMFYCSLWLHYNIFTI
nr:MAG TPA: hypothetical protein [Caudoviricetes sp.]